MESALFLKIFLTLYFISVALPYPVAAQENYNAVLDTMELGVRRSLKELRLEGEGPPYFLLYRLGIVRHEAVNCLYGDVGSRSDSTVQIPYVEARVGTYDLDNTWEGFATSESLGVGSLNLSTSALAHTFWHLTDTAYKNALRRYYEKKSRLVQEMETEKLPDFSRENPSRSSGSSSELPALDQNLMENLCRSASEEFRKYPEVLFGSVYLGFSQDIRLLVNSEGTRLVAEAAYTPYTYSISGWARAPDGLTVDSYRSGQVRYSGELPDEKKFSRLVAEVAAEVAGLKSAPLMTPGIAPALVDGESTGVFFHEAIGHRLEGHRQREKSELQTFRGKVGRRIIPSFISLYSDPSLNSRGMEALSGHYLFDAEGIPSRRVSLVENGVLRNFLMSRRPAEGFLKSNGHGRSDAYRMPEARMAVLIIEAGAGGLAPEELKPFLLREIRDKRKAFGLRMVAMRSGEAQTNRGSSQSFVGRPRLIYRVEPDGKETLVRGLEYVGTPLVAIEKIVAAGREPEVANAYCGSASGFIPVTQISPAVVLSEIELQREQEDRFRPPILESPIFKKGE